MYQDLWLIILNYYLHYFIKNKQDIFSLGCFPLIAIPSVTKENHLEINHFPSINIDHGEWKAKGRGGGGGGGAKS